MMMRMMMTDSVTFKRPKEQRGAKHTHKSVVRKATTMMRKGMERSTWNQWRTSKIDRARRTDLAQST